MSDALVIFAGAVVAPVGFVVCVSVAFLMGRWIVKDWRHQFRKPPVMSTHQRAALAHFDEAAHAVLFASALVGLTDHVETDEERDQLTAASIRNLLDAQESFELCASLLQEDQS